MCSSDRIYAAVKACLCGLYKPCSGHTSQRMNYGWVGFKTEIETAIFSENKTETET